MWRQSVACDTCPTLNDCIQKLINWSKPQEDNNCLADLEIKHVSTSRKMSIFYY